MSDMGLTVVEQTELEFLENRMEKALEFATAASITLAECLKQIHEKQLYKSYGTFDNYCRERWQRGRQWGYQLIDAARTIKNLMDSDSVRNCVQALPATESQARPLTKLEPDLQPIAWKQAVDTAPDGKVTAKHVEATVQQFRPTPTKEEVPEIHPRALPLTAANHGISSNPDYDGDEWYTPLEFIEAARRVMGDIDLDPASCYEAQEVIKARHYYTKQDDSLQSAFEWRGRVWLNPPYSMPLIKQFVTKLIDQFDMGHVSQAVILTNNSSDTSWFHELLSRFPACFTRGRVQFWRANHEAFGARQGQTLFYLGEDMTKFAQEFSQLGQVVIRL